MSTNVFAGMEIGPPVQLRKALALPEQERAVLFQVPFGAVAVRSTIAPGARATEDQPVIERLQGFPIIVMTAGASRAAARLLDETLNVTVVLSGV
jgi:hypothetical protein